VAIDDPEEVPERPLRAPEVAGNPIMRVPSMALTSGSRGVSRDEM